MAAVVGLDENWLDFILGDVWYVLRGFTGKKYATIVRRKSNSLWSSMWDVKSTKLKLGGFSSNDKDDFMATDDFKRLLRGYVDVMELFHTFRLASKPWQRIAVEKIDGDFRSGVLAFHDGKM